MHDIYSIPPVPNIKIETHFQGRKINKKFYTKNPDLFKDFPSKADVLVKWNELLKDKHKGASYTLIVFKEGISVIET